MLAKGGVQGVGLVVVVSTHFKGSQHVWGLLQVNNCWKAIDCASAAKAGCQIQSVYLCGDSTLMPSANLNRHQMNQWQQHAVCSSNWLTNSLA